MEPAPKRSATKIDCPDENCHRKMVAHNLRQHLRDVHKYTETDILHFNNSLKQKKGDEKGVGTYSCSVCSYVVGTKAAMDKHIKNNHGPPNQKTVDPASIQLHAPRIVLPTPTFNPPERGKRLVAQPAALSQSSSRAEHTESLGTVACPSCKLTFMQIQQLSEHYGATHATDDTRANYTVVHEQFDSSAKFEKWREENESRTCTSFYERNTRMDGTRRTEYYRCHRSGKFSRAGIRRVNESKKNLPHCSAFMKVYRYEDGTVDVTASFGHCGHGLNWAVLKLTNEETAVIKGMFEDKLTDSAIQEILRDRYRNEESKLYCVTKTDLRNLRVKLGMVPGRLHNDDLTSVEMRIEADAETDGFKKYMKATDETGKGFVLVILTPQQIDWIKKYGKKGVVLDDTHNVTKYSFKLTTMMVLDSKDRGLPAAFLLSSSVASDDIAHLFDAVRAAVPGFKPKRFMSDEANAFWNAYVKVFPEFEQFTAKLLCRWHVYQAWKKKAKELIRGDQAKLGRVLKKLRELLLIPDEIQFRRSMVELLSFLEGNECSYFSDYFRTNYSGRVNEWATFARPGAIFHTSMYSESWHSKLKCEMMGKKANVRMDFLLYIMYKAVNDIFDNHKISDMKNLKVPRKTQTHSKHRHAIEAYHHSPVSIQSFEEDGGWKWLVDSTTSSRQYEVVRELECECDEKMNMHCTLCNVCPYAYKCGCLDQKAGVACMHKHAVMMFGEGHGAETSEGAVDDSQTGFDYYSPSNAVDTATSMPDGIQDSGSATNFVRQLSEKERRMAICNRTRQEWSGVNHAITTLAKMEDASSRSLMERIEEKVAELHMWTSEQMTANHATAAMMRIAPRADAGRLNQQTLPQRIEKRTEKTKRAREKEDRIEEQRNLAPINMRRNEVTVCDICHMVDPILPEDIDPEEEESRETAWLMCESCQLWVHMCCGRAAEKRRCITCKKGLYINSVDAEESEESEESETERESSHYEESD